MSNWSVLTNHEVTGLTKLRVFAGLGTQLDVLRDGHGGSRFGSDRLDCPAVSIDHGFTIDFRGQWRNPITRIRRGKTNRKFRFHIEYHIGTIEKG